MELEPIQYLQYAAALFFVLALIGVLVWVLKRISGGKVRSGSRRGRRLAVLEATMVDKRRRLVLVRRDDLEHLIMIGGPQDVVIETGIEPPADEGSDMLQPAEGAHARKTPPAPVHVRPPVREPVPARATGYVPEPRSRPAPPPAPPVPSARPERDISNPFSDRPAPDHFKPDPVEPEPGTDSAPPRRSMLNVRPGEQK